MNFNVFVAFSTFNFKKYTPFEKLEVLIEKLEEFLAGLDDHP